jgi:tetratricopeptide (TPR) repeat protein
VYPSDKPPYPGLRPFERDESHLFFGRDHCVDDMIERLAERRFLAVLGSSGTGKSSLVRTGLFSALEMGLLSGAGSRWLIVDFRPGGDPLGNLARALFEAECAVTKRTSRCGPYIATLERRFKQEGRRELIKWCREGHLAEGTNLLILVDQFEELFRYQKAEWREDAQALVNLLLESRWPRGLASPQRAEIPIYVTITLRSEYLGACALIWGLPEAINEGTYLTPRMKRQECEEAILGPARVCGLDVDPQLVTKLLNDMADFAPWDVEGNKDQLTRLARSADQLPLMQHALNQMWRRASRQRKGDEEIVLKLADYRGLERELDSHAEDVFASLDASNQATAERIFRAVTQGATVANAVRRPTRYGPGRTAAGAQQPHDGQFDAGGQLRDQQPQDDQSQDEQDNIIDICGGTRKRKTVFNVLAAFGPEGCQFLTANPRPAVGQSANDDAWIDIAHESLIRQWQRSSRWLEKEGQAARQWQQLKEKAEKKDWLIGRSLSDAKKFRKEGQPTRAWAARYGGGFERVDRFIEWSNRRHWGVVGVALAILVAVCLLMGTSYYSIQRSNIANQKIEQATNSAQKLVDELGTSWSRGDVTLKGAKDMLQVAGDIVGTTTTSANDVGPLIKLGLTASDLYGDFGDYGQALQRATEARNLAERLRTAKPNDKGALQLLYASIWRIADSMAENGAYDKALDQYVEAKDLALQVKELPPEDGADDRELMFIDQKIGDIRLTQKQYDAAEVEFRTALEAIQRALRKVPNNRKWQLDAANTRRRLARALAGKQEVTGASEQFTIAVTDLTKLAKEAEDDEVGLSNLASAHREIGDFDRQRQDLDDALAEYREAIKVQKRQNDKDPSNATWIVSLASTYRMAAMVLRQQDKLEGAAENYEKVRAFREQLFNRDRVNPLRQTALAKANIDLADVKTELARNLDEAAREQGLRMAVTLYRSAIEIFDELRPSFDRNVFDCYVKIGDIQMLQSNPEDALKGFKAASGIALEKTNTAGDLGWQGRLANSYVKIGDALAAQKLARQAITEYEKALGITTTLAKKYPQSTEWTSKTEEVNSRIRNLAPMSSTRETGAPQ